MPEINKFAGVIKTLGWDGSTRKGAIQPSLEGGGVPGNVCPRECRFKDPQKRFEDPLPFRRSQTVRRLRKNRQKNRALYPRTPTPDKTTGLEVKMRVSTFFPLKIDSMVTGDDFQYKIV